MFPTSLCFTVLLFHSFFSFLFILSNIEEHTRESTGKVSIASRPCGFDSFYPLCYNRSIEEAKAHTL